jgi:hypothetical protein
LPPAKDIRLISYISRNFTDMKYLLIAIAVFFSTVLMAQKKVVSDTLFLQSGDTLVGKIERADKRYVYFKDRAGKDLQINRAVIKYDSKEALSLDFNNAALDYSKSLTSASAAFITGGTVTLLGGAMIMIGVLKPEKVVTDYTIPGGAGFPPYSFSTVTERYNRSLIYGGIGALALGAIFNIVGGVSLSGASKEVKLNNGNAAIIEYDIYGASAAVRLRF